MKLFVKPNGVELLVNAASYEFAISLGWKPKEEPKEPEESAPEEVGEAPKRRGRPPKDKP